MTPIIYVEETSSTNTFLKELLASRRVEESTTIYAKHQTSGRGQRGNSWESEDGKNLLASLVIFPFMLKANDQFIISQMISLAIKNTLNKFTDDISIKWPNDIYWKDSKICGILIENSLVDDTIDNSIIGFGININQEAFSKEIPNPISLKNILNKESVLGDILVEILSQFQEYYKILKAGKRAQIISSYKNSLYRKKGFHQYKEGDKKFSAQIKDVEPSGLFVLETDKGELKKFAFKEISYVI